ncbi:dual specificity protein phosphatase 12 [Neoconidiobolus thromboides FSU 785]|nr:dual specificity protein phosphatase 12 [Neoconidiobolus thromboides FSU 785]
MKNKIKIEPPKLLNLDVSEKTLAISLCDQIKEHLYLGSYDALQKPQLLETLNITHILTVGKNMNNCNLTEKIIRLQINVFDEENENLLQYFDQTNNFIDAAIKQNGNVLVHCMAGISRSATVVIAYLMKKHNWSVEEALNQVTKARSIIDPNPGFREQLQLYYEINYEVDIKNELYRRFLITKMSSDFISQGFSKDMILGIDPEQIMNGTMFPGNTIQKIRCKRCRRALINPENIIPHEVGSGQTDFNYRKRDPMFSNHKKEESCSSYFIEPMDWIEGIKEGHIDGKIECPKCHTKLGTYSWRGSQCSCGKWITPAFMIHRSRVDTMSARSISFHQ